MNHNYKFFIFYLSAFMLFICQSFGQATNILSQSNSCGRACDLVGDGDFSQYHSNCLDTISPFISCVPCWLCSHGSPQAGGIAGNYFAKMWCDYYAQPGDSGEGVQTTLFDSLAIGDPAIMYIFQLRYRLDSLSARGTNFNIHAKLTTFKAAKNANPPFTCDGASGGNPPMPDADSVYAIPITTNSNNYNWVKSNTCILSSGLYISGLNVLWIYPTSDALAWVNVDSVHMYMINASLGDSAKCICSTSTLRPATNCLPPGDLTYSWYKNNTIIPSATADSLVISPVSVQTTYKLKMTYNGSCSVSSQIIILPRCTPPFSIQPAAKQICSGNNVITFTIDPPGAKYIWSTGATTASVTLTAVLNTDDTIAVAVTDNFGCIGTDTLSFHWLPYPSIILNASSSICDSNNKYTVMVNISGDSGLYNYQWYTGPTASNVNAIHDADSAMIKIPPGIYTVAVTDQSQCVGLQTDTVGFDVFTVATNSHCGYDASIQAIIKGGTAGASAYSYLWSPGGATTSAVSRFAPGTYSVAVTNDSTGCSETKKVVIKGNLTLTVASSRATCYGINNGTAYAIADSGTGNYTYKWNTGATTSSLYPVAPVTYTVTVKSGMCTDSASVQVYDSLPVNITVTSICKGGRDSLLATGASTYRWSPSTGLSDTTGATVIAKLYSTTTTYTVTGTINGCSGTAIVTVSIDSLCDSVAAVQNLSPQSLKFEMFPDPLVNEEITFSYTISSWQGVLDIYNVEGEKIAEYILPRWSSAQHVKLPGISSGLYLARLTQGSVTASIKFLKE